MKRLLAFLTVFSMVASVGQAETTINTLTVNQWVQPTEDGVLNGRIVVPAANGASKAVEGADVAVIGQDGKALRGVAKTNAKGEFTIKDVKPGVYALSARADFVFAACAMHVLDSDLVGEQEFPSQAEVSAANVDFTTVKTAVIRYLPPSPKQLDASIEDARLASLAEQVCGEQSFRVAQTAGGLRGRLHSAGAFNGNLNGAQHTNVFIIKNGAEVARTITDDNGGFEVAQLGAGSYSLMAVGPAGLGLIGFELVDEDEIDTKTAAITADGKQLVGLLGGGCCCQELAMQVAPMPTNIVQDVVVETPVAQSCGCGQPAAQCGCGVPVSPCGCDGMIVDGGGYVEGAVVDGGYAQGGIVDGGAIVDGGGVVMDGFGTPVAGGGFGSPIAGGGFSGGGGFAGGFGGGGGIAGGGFGGGGGGLLAGGGGLGGLAALAGVGGIIAATTSDDDDAVIATPPAVSPAVPN